MEQICIEMINRLKDEVESPKQIARKIALRLDMNLQQAERIVDNYISTHS